MLYIIAFQNLLNTQIQPFHDLELKVFRKGQTYRGSDILFFATNIIKIVFIPKRKKYIMFKFNSVFV